MYRDERVSHGLPAATPWDIGGPQPVVQRLVALGAVQGEVLDPGTGPGHHAIYYASAGLLGDRHRRFGGALERARENARRAGVSVDFQLADATELEGLENRLRHRRRLRLLPHLQHRPRAAAVLCAGAAPGDQAGRAALHVRVRRARCQRLHMMPLVVRGRLSRRSARRRLGDHLSRADHLSGQHERRPLELMAARNPIWPTKPKALLERFRMMEPWLANGRPTPRLGVHATRWVSRPPDLSRPPTHKRLLDTPNVSQRIMSWRIPAVCSDVFRLVDDVLIGSEAVGQGRRVRISCEPGSVRSIPTFTGGVGAGIASTRSVGGVAVVGPTRRRVRACRGRGARLGLDRRRRAHRVDLA